MRRCARPWLLPLVPIYAAGAAVAAHCKRERRLQWPVVSIGNLSTGGSGKTPLTMELARLMNEAGVGVDVLSRGYGRQGAGAARVNPAASAEEFGDEPLLMAQQTGLPVYVARRRYEAGVKAERELATLSHGMRVHLLDDGMQHQQLHREVEIVLLSQRDWRDCMLPAGNLREPRSALRRADVVAIASDEADLEDQLRRFGFAGRVWRIVRTMGVRDAVADHGNQAAAFCGIAHPESFFEGIESAAVALRTKFAFADHHRYTPLEVDRITDEALKVGARILLTTEKDLARLGGLRMRCEERISLCAVALRCEIQNAEAEMQWLGRKLRAGAELAVGD